MASAIDIVNRALLRMSARAQVSQINPSDGSAEADAASVLFTPTYEMLARAAHWNIFRKQEKLTLLKAAQGTPENVDGTVLPVPPTPWLYSYAYPSDCLMERYLIPPGSSAWSGTPLFSSTVPAPVMTQLSPVEFLVAHDTDSSDNPIRVILANTSQAEAVYTVNQPNPAQWDSQFQEAMVSSLAVYLIPALSGNAAMMQLSMKNAEQIVAQARLTDGNEGLTIVDNIPDWIANRGTSWASGNSLFMTPYSDLSWPNF